jgi:hypothetical protein
VSPTGRVNLWWFRTRNPGVRAPQRVPPRRQGAWGPPRRCRSQPVAGCASELRAPASRDEVRDRPGAVTPRPRSPPDAVREHRPGGTRKTGMQARDLNQRLLTSSRVALLQMRYTAASDLLGREAFRGVGQVRTRPENPRVGGSIPPPGTPSRPASEGPVDCKVRWASVFLGERSRRFVEASVFSRARSCVRRSPDSATVRCTRERHRRERRGGCDEVLVREPPVHGESQPLRPADRRQAALSAAHSCS